MAAIYQDSTVCLAATNARDSSIGLFSSWPRSASHSWSPESEIHQSTQVTHSHYSIVDETGNNRALLIRNKSRAGNVNINALNWRQNHYTWSDRMMTTDAGPFPLLMRGWAHQELLLALRVIHFGPGFLVVDCGQDVVCEDRHYNGDLVST